MSSIAYSFAVTTSAPQIMPAGTVEHPNLITLLSYWEHLRGPDPMPARVEARKDVSSLLKYVHLCDVMDHGENFRFNVIGDAVFQGLSENPVGHLVSEHPDMGVRLRFPILMREVVRTKNPVRGLAIRETQRGSFHAEIDLVAIRRPRRKANSGHDDVRHHWQRPTIATDRSAKAKFPSLEYGITVIGRHA